MSDEFFERRVGTVIKGKWTLEKLLGVGGMAAVYLGRHRIGRSDAIKILHPIAGRSPELRARFEQEARAVSQLGHPGVARIDDIDKTEDGSLFMVMELLEGESLGDRLERGGATVPDTLRWAEELLDVVSAAHELGIVHRDIKPDNVFILKDGTIKLLDFGVAHVRDTDSLKTATGVALGTLPFMAPEQVRGEKIDHRADLFAIGATMVRAIARRSIHEASADAELYLKMGTQPAPPARTLLPSAPEALWPIIDTALAFDRERRYQTAKDMRQDIVAVRSGRLPAHALSSTRIEPIADEVSAAGSPILDPYLAAPAVPPPPRSLLDRVTRSPRALVGVLAGSVVAGIAIAVIAMLVAFGGKKRESAATAPSGAPTVPGAPATPPPPTAPTAGPTSPPPGPRPAPPPDDDDRKKEKKQEKKPKKKKDKKGGKKKNGAP